MTQDDRASLPVRILLLPIIPVFLVMELLVWACSGRKMWREPGGPTVGALVFGWLGLDVSEAVRCKSCGVYVEVGSVGPRCPECGAG